MRCASLFLLLAIVCSGQMCGVPAPNGGGQMGIPAGVYSGQVTLTSTLTYVGQDGNLDFPAEPITFTVTREFGAHGGPLNGNGLPLSYGDVSEDGELVVESVFIDFGKAIVVNKSDYEMPGLEELLGETIHFTGIETTTYTDLGGGQIRVESEARETSQMIDGEFLRTVAQTTGILSR